MMNQVPETHCFANSCEELDRLNKDVFCSEPIGTMPFAAEGFGEECAVDAIMIRL